SAVDDAVVEGDGDRARRAGDDLAVADHGPLGGAADAEDADLGIVDDGRRQKAAQLASTRDGEGRAAELLGLELVGSGGLGEPGELVRQLVDGGGCAVRAPRARA